MHSHGLALLRLLAALRCGLGGALICALLFPFLTPAGRMDHVGRWSRRMLRSLGITLQTSGSPAPGPVLVASNHVSWLDILAIDAVQPVRFVSKADVRHWPVLGWMVACGGTLFIERERKRDAMRVVHLMADALRAGDHVAVFPEGTTADGPVLLPFHANLLQAAVATGTPVQGVVLRFHDPQHAFSPAATYVGDTTLAQSLWAIAGCRGLQVQVTLLPPRATAGVNRRELADALRAEIDAVLALAR